MAWPMMNVDAKVSSLNGQPMGNNMAVSLKVEECLKGR